MDGIQCLMTALPMLPRTNVYVGAARNVRYCVLHHLSPCCPLDMCLASYHEPMLKMARNVR